STTFATLVFFLTIRPPPISTLFPYTTLFRSVFHRKRSPPVYSNYRSHFGTTNLIFLRNTRATKCGWKLCPNSEKLRQNLMVSCRSEEHTSELQSREISYAVFCLKKKKIQKRE